MARQAVKNFELDLEIHDELEFYKENKEVLGKHPIFWEYNLKEQVEKYGGFELANRQKTLRANISRDKKKHAKMPRGPKKEKFEAVLLKYKIELELVNNRINDLKRKQVL